jgi:hypothetical protein
MNGVELIAAERKRQVEAEGYTAAHDDAHVNSEIALAGACYAIPDGDDRAELIEFPSHTTIDGMRIAPLWPWAHRWYKRTPLDRVRELVKAGALIAAEIDRLQRAVEEVESDG